MRVARVQAQAKINLMLRVFPTRDVMGYHDVQTWFHRVDLADEIIVRAGGTGRSIDCRGPRMPPGGLGASEDNLAYKAAVEFSNRAGWPKGFAIEVTKHIPVGGGLGGGSADAGAVLRALNVLAPNPISPDEIWSAGCLLGSDVPFLASEYLHATGSGRGTRLSNGSDQPWPHPSALIVAPSFSIRTADAYRWLDEDRERLGWNPLQGLSEYVGLFGEGLQPGDASLETRAKLLDMTLINDFEPSVEARHPELKTIRDRLKKKGAELARLAGSGSCVFGIFPDIPSADAEPEFNAEVIRTRLSSRVVQVEVLE